MNDSENKVASAYWVPLVAELIKNGNSFKISPSGMSMYPFLVGGRDEVILVEAKDLKRGDIVLYKRDNGLHVLHRIYKVDGDRYYMVGDAQASIEGPLRRDQIIAVARNVIRKGKQTSCDDKKFVIKSAIWMKLRRFRPTLIKMWWAIRKINPKNRVGNQVKKTA